jgi:predicted metal-dependent enzyme (double-stranded beta helix superfamily)
MEKSAKSIAAAAPLKSFIEEIKSLLGKRDNGARTVNQVKKHLIELLETPRWLPRPCRSGESRSYARHLLYQDRKTGFVIVAMVWGAGQRTAVHDHAGVWCVEGVYEGNIQVTRFNKIGRMGKTVRFEQGEEIQAGVGACGALIPPVEYHRIANETRDKAISVHVYGRDLKVCNIFNPLGGDLYQRVEKTMQYNSVIPLKV